MAKPPQYSTSTADLDRRPTDAAVAAALQAALTGDPEIDHGLADDVLCDTLERLGYRETVRCFRALEKWYA